MRACHTCGFYSDGWCTLRNQGQSAGGSCSNWSGRGTIKGNRHSGKKTYRERSHRSTLACANCIWWKKGKCKNKKSQAYDDYMTSGSLCTAFENVDGYILEKDKERCEKLLKGKRSDSPKHSLPAENATTSSTLRNYRKNPACATCIWRRKEKCGNRESDNFKAIMPAAGFCMLYEHKSGYRIREIPTETTKSKPKRTYKKSVKSTEGISPIVTESKSNPNNTVINEIKSTDNPSIDNPRKTDHCNRCKYLSDTGLCRNEQSSSYGKKVHKLSSCAYYKFWREK